MHRAACPSASRSRARSSRTAFAVANWTSRSSCRAISSIALLLEALTCGPAHGQGVLVPSRLIVPTVSTPASWASRNTCTNNGGPAKRWRGRRRPWRGRDGGCPRWSGTAATHTSIRRPLDLARTEHAPRIPIKDQGEQHLGGVRLPAAPSIVGVEGREVEQGHAVHHEAGQMVGRQAVAQANGQVERCVIVHGFEASTHTYKSISAHKTENPLLSDKRLEPLMHNRNPSVIFVTAA